MLVYFFWWHKPKDVNQPIEVLQRTDFPTNETFISCTRLVSEARRFIPVEYILNSVNCHTDALTATLLGLPTCVFHLLAWNSHFPSSPEQWIWRVSAIRIGIAPTIMYLQFLLSTSIVTYRWDANAGDLLYCRVHKLVMDKFPAAPGNPRTIRYWSELRLGEVPLYVSILLNLLVYCCCSFLLSLVAFLSLRSVPEQSYETVVWGNYWPHF